MRYQKRINNNVVVAVDKDGCEQVIMGKGLGFGMIAGEEVEEARIEKIFTLKDTKANQRLLELMHTIPFEHIELAEEIVTYARMQIDNAINDNVIVSLCDHIYMAVKRMNECIEVKNPMLWDIQKFYNDEYLVGLYAIDMIKERFNVQLSEDEAGFIALHLVNAQLNINKKSVQEITALMQEIEKIVRLYFRIDLDVESVYYYRFITHLKFFAERLFTDKAYQNNQDVESMLSFVQQKYPKEWDCVKKIALYISNQFGCEIGDEERLYLCIHISRIVQISK